MHRDSSLYMYRQLQLGQWCV